MSNPAFSRRDAFRWAGNLAIASTFLPMGGRYRVWAHPVDSNKLVTRPLGRTGREVTTFGLAGGNKVMWTQPGDEAVAIVVKAVRSGMTYLETANNYQDSQLNYGRAFRILNLVPGQPGYDAGLRARLFLATKTSLRTSVVRGDAKPIGKSASHNATAPEDVKRSLTQFFGDGKGYIPDGAYLDLVQIHSLTHASEVDAVFEGMSDPSDKTITRIGVLAGLIDMRDGTNVTGVNPEHRKWIRHIGITGHENPTVHMYAMRRDTGNNIQTLLVAINPNDPNYFCHQTNSVPLAAAKNMGIIGMKVFADGVMYGLPKKFAGHPGQSVLSVGKPGKVPYQDFLHYTLSAPGVSTCITGIGLIDKDNDPEKDQLIANLAACQMAEPLSTARRKQIEAQVGDLCGTDTNFFQRPSSGLLAPSNVSVERAADGGPVKVLWNTAYAGPDPIVRYEVYRRDEKIATVPYHPQMTEAPLSFTDESAPASSQGGIWYRVRTVDVTGRSVDSISAKPV